MTSQERQFGRLIFIANAGRGKHNHKLARVRCFCGTKFTVRWEQLRRGVVKSCGCRSTKFKPGHKPSTYRHGQSAGNGSREYRSWCLMRRRCLRRCPEFGYYGGAHPPVRICKRWQGVRGFENFVEDLGPRAEGKSISRYLDAGHYSCGGCAECVANGWLRNCEWMNPVEQGAERRGKFAVKLLHAFHVRQKRRKAA